MEKDDLLSVSDDEQEYHTYFTSGVPEPFRVAAPQAYGSEMPHQANVPRTSHPPGLLPTPPSPQKQFFPCNPGPTFNAQPGLSSGRGGHHAEQRGPGIQQSSRHSSQQRPSLQSPERRTDLPSQRSQAVVHPTPRVAMQERSESRCTIASEAELQIDLSFETPLPSQKAPVLATVVDLEDASRPSSSASTGTPTKQQLGRKESLQADETSDEDGENVGVPSGVEKPTMSTGVQKSAVGDELDRLLQELQKTVAVPTEGSSKNEKRPKPIWGAVVDTSGMKVRSPSDHDPSVRGKDRHFRFRVDLKREELRLKHIREAPEDKQDELLAMDQWTVDDTLNRVRYMPPTRQGDALDDTPHLKLLNEHCNLLYEHYRLEVQSAGVYRTSKERKEGWLQDRKKLEKAEKDLAAERETVGGLTKDLGAVNGKVTSLEAQLSSAKDDVSKLEKRLDAAKKQLSTQANQLKTKDQDARETVQKELSTKDAEIESLKDQVKKLKAKQAGAAVRSTTDTEKDKADKELKRLRKANKDLTDANEKLQEELRKDNEKKLMTEVFGDDEHDDRGTQTDPLAETQLIEDLTEKLKTSTSDVQKLNKQFTQADQERKKAKAAAKTEQLARQEAEQALEDTKAQFEQEKEAARRSFVEEFARYKAEAEQALKEATPAAEAELEKMDAMAKKIATQNDVIKMQADRLEGARKVKEAMLKRACLRCSAARSEASTSTSLGTVSVAVGTDDRPEPEYTVEGESGLLTPPAGISAAPSTDEEHASAKRARLAETTQLDQVMDTRFRPEPRDGDEDSPPLDFHDRKPNIAELRKQGKEREERKNLAADLTTKILETLETMLQSASTSTTPAVNETSTVEAQQASASAAVTPEQPSSSGTPQPAAEARSTSRSGQQTPKTVEDMLRTSPRTTEEIRVNPTSLLAPTEGTLLPLHVATDAPAPMMAATTQRPIKGMPQQQPHGQMPPRQSQGQMPHLQPQGPMPPQQPRGQMPHQQPQGQVPPQQPQGQIPPQQPRGQMPHQQPQGQVPFQQPHGRMPPGQMPPQHAQGQMPLQRGMPHQPAQSSRSDPCGSSPPQQRHTPSHIPPLYIATPPNPAAPQQPPQLSPQSLAVYRQWLIQQHQQSMPPPQGGMPPSMAQFHHQQQQMYAAQQPHQFQMHPPSGSMAFGQFAMHGAIPGANFQGMPQFVVQHAPQPAPQPAPSGSAGQGPSPPGRGRKRKNQQQQRTPPQAAVQQPPPQAAAQQQRTPPQAAAQQQQPPQMVNQLEMIQALLVPCMEEIRRENPGATLQLVQIREMLVARHPHLQNVIDNLLTAASSYRPQPGAS